MAILASALPPAWLRWAALWAGLLLWLATPRWRWLGALLAGLGWTCVHAGWGLDEQLTAHREAQEVTVTGAVSSLPRHEVRRTRFQLRLDASADLPADLRGRAVQVSWYDDFGATVPGPRLQVHAGERWQLSLRLRAPRGLVNPGGFDAERHALAQGIAASGIVRQSPAPQRLAPAAGLGAWRERMAARIAVQVPAASSRYVQALALGDTRGLGEFDWQVLRATGLTHLIAISGFHVGMVALCAAWLVAGLWRLLPWCGRY
ncbi:MAG: ComEC/Rec2 family competence protein, partial [Stenotrophomonas sp.]